MAGTSNQKISFKKKEYNEETDSGNGVIVFDSSENKIYVGGVCYSSDVSDASYNSTNKTLTITKRNGSSSTVDIVRSINDLTDTTITTPSTGDFLLYDDDSDMWENVTPSIIEIEESSGEIFEDALVDNDGNSYKAAIIGDQVWMIENLKTTTYTDGTTIPDSDTYDTGNYYRTYPGETTENVADYGRLYNGTAATHGVEIDNGESGGRAVKAGSLLPEGWRIPTSSEFETLMANISENQGPIKASESWYGESNEVYAVKFNPQYAGMVYGRIADPKGGEKISSGGRSNYYGFGEYMYMWSRTQEYNGGGDIVAKAGQSNSTQLNIVVCQYYDPNSGGGSVEKGSSRSSGDVVVADNAHIYYGTEDTGNFCSIRGVYDGTPEEFLEEYYRTHQNPDEGGSTPEGKFLKNVGNNQLAWSDISYNDLKERPFGETHFESSVSLPMEDSNGLGYENTNPSSGVLCSYLDLSNTGISQNNFPTKMIIDGTIEVELVENNAEYGNLLYLEGLYYDNSPYGDSTGEGWGIDFGEGYLYTLTSEFGNTPPTVELVFDNTNIKKIDNKFLDLADVAFSGSYDDLSDIPDSVTSGANIIHVGYYYGSQIMTGQCDKLDYQISSNSYLFVDFQKTCNSSNLRYFQVVNGRGVTVCPNFPIWINGEAASSTNYIIPAGMYIVYYDGTKYMLRTDGKLTVNGNVFDGTIQTIQPSNITIRNWAYE